MSVRTSILLSFSTEQMKENVEAEPLSSFCLAARKKGWQQAVLDRYGNLDKAPWIADSSRADPLLFSTLSHDSNILDLGAGYGVISFAISTLCRSVTTLNTNRDYAHFIRTRAQQDGVTNITSLHGDFTRIPFRESSFDMIILNKGILSLLMQKDAKILLKHIHILLKPKGEIYIAVDQYKRNINPFSFSHKRLAKQLLSVGFHINKVLIPLKRYKNFKFLCEYENKSTYHFFLQLVAKEYTTTTFSEKLFKNILKIIYLIRLNKLLFRNITSISYLLIARKA